MRSRSVIYLALAAGVFMLSASGVFAKVARAPAGIIAFYRLFFATLALLPWLLSHKNDRRELRSLSPIQYAEGALAGFFLAVHYVMWFESLRYTSVASSTVLAALQPLFSVIWGRLFLGETLSAHALTGGAIAIAGLAVVGWSDFSVSSQSLWGDLLALVSGGVISLYFFCGQILRRRMGAVPYSVLSYGSSAVVLALYALFMGYPFAGYAPGTWGAFLGLALVSTIGGQMVFNVLLKWISATTVTMGILGEPVGTCFLAWLFLGETLSARQAIGIAVILAGLALFFAAQRQSQSERK
ncbi:DMT family transporter [Pyramidobacter sp. C12-8]|uniref:DMT family transporter n=1 Tax=Pyramidobacter sp. C12-8 TaxID=1943580 RepID=UPI00098EFDF3|nr:DMT family transporter [Pyramidobacter sp. C12-8]OON90081.1 EamA family transporter [Pyramidobacter sp. C12-8]